MKSSKLSKLLTLIFFTGVLSFCFLQIQKIKPFEVQKLLEENHPLRISYEDFNQKYNDENKVFILIENKTEFTANSANDFLDKINQQLHLSNQFQSYTTALNAKYISYDEKGFQLIPFIKDGTWNKGAEEKLAEDFWKNSIISVDKKSLLAVVTLSSKMPRKNRYQAIDRILRIFNYEAHLHPGIDTYFLGTEVANYWFTKEMIKNQVLITPLLMLLICVFFWFMFRSLKMIFASISVIILAYALMIILITIVEDGIGPYSSFALMFVSIIATSDLIHFFSRLGANNNNIKSTIKEIIAPCFLTSLTTAVGFFSLILNENVPVRYFGLYCTLGTIFCFLITFLFLPKIIDILNLKMPYLEESKDDPRIWKIVKKYQSSIISFFAITSIVFAYESTTLHIDDNLYKKFIDSHPISKAVEKFENGFNFVGSIDIIIKSKDGAILSDGNILQVENFENELLKLPISSHIKSFTQMYEDIKKDIEKVHVNEKEQNSVMDSFINLASDYGALSSFYKRSTNEIRTTLFVKDLNSVALEKTLKEIDNISSHYKSLNIEVNGFAAIRNYINQNVIRSFIKSFVTSLILIFVVFLVLFRSIKWATLAMVPNIYPLLTISGLMGLFNITMESNLVILVSITIGIAVDDTIHFIFNIIKKRKEGIDISNAVKSTLLKTSKALVGTTSVFLFTFPTFMLADLKLFFQVGFFILLSLFAALMADLFLMPSLLLKLEKRNLL